MWQFLLGFGTGIYVGTIYDCRPCMKYAQKQIEEYVPRKKWDEDDDEDKNNNKKSNGNEKKD